jgi:hypothetical protein
MVLVVRDVRGSRPFGLVQRDTTSDGMLAFGHNRSGTTRCSAADSARALGACGRRFEPCHRDQPREAEPPQRVLGCGRSSTAELRDVTPPVPVRLRPVTPKRMLASRTRAAEYRAFNSACQGSSPWRRTNHPLVAESADAPVLETGAHRLCPFDSDRGDQSTAMTAKHCERIVAHPTQLGR